MSTWDFVRDPSSIRLLVNYGELHGVSAPTLLRRTGLHKEQLQDPNVEVQATQELLVIANLIKALKNPPLLGLDVGLQYGFTTYGIWGYGLISSATVGDALSLALRFMPLTYAFTQISTTHLDEQIVIKFAPPAVDEPVRTFLGLRDLAAATRLIADLMGQQVQLTSLKLSIPAPRAEQTRGMPPGLLGCPFEFQSDLNAFSLSTQHLLRPLPNANPLTASMCEQLCAALVEKRRRRYGTAELVKTHLLSSSGQAMPDLPRMARLLYTTERTLKRRLQAEGVTFRHLQATARQQLASDLLQDDTLSLDEIGSRLGFSDQSSFSQAFKRWTGHAPGQWRKQTRKDIP
ncbi:MAG: AraC family transcriptional regulator [Aquabacterium sp.]|uniref:AraC family transcriptional regulator n=1 Tax=Aquabacterium sp. TaxID=1872578 RepID=UPI003BE329BE